MFLPDTNILIYAVAGREPFATLLTRWVSKNQLVFSVISISEFMVGADLEEKEKLINLVESSNIYDIDYQTAVIAANCRQEFMKKKKKVYLLDCMLAATAKTKNCTLVTVNTDDFPMKDIKLLNPLLPIKTTKVPTASNS